MTQDEILALPNLSIAEITKFLHIHSQEGYFIANIPDDMMDYYFTNCLYLPIKDEYEDLQVVSEDENAQNLKVKELLEQTDKLLNSFDDDEPMVISGQTF